MQNKSHEKPIKISLIIFFYAFLSSVPVYTVFLVSVCPFSLLQLTTFLYVFNDRSMSIQ